VLFPISLHASAGAPEAAPFPEELRGHGERILFVDDEEPLVSVSGRFLERLGYRVSGHTRPEDALAAFRDRPDAFDLVVTDYNMPSMSGMDVALVVMGLRPDVPVALASGYMRPAEIEHARALGIRATIAKPNSLEELGAIVQRLLHARHEQR
jgi:CheY-like chemotaxis protein